MTREENELVSLAISGDEDALSALLRMHGPIVRQQIAPTISDKWQSVLDVDDVMQVTYLEAFMSVDGFVNKGTGAFAGWLKRIAMNNLRDAIRELERMKRPQPEDRLQPMSPDESAVCLLDDLGCTTTTPSRHAAQGEVRSAIESAVKQLPEDYSDVVRLYDLEGKPAQTVADSMGRSVGAVYMLRARAHDLLRRSFATDSRFITRST